MARIRSVHPGLFTDEAFMSASPLARVFMIGLWTEADDNGVFEWKPLVLKARILPADMVDGAALLAELVSLNAIMRFEAEGKPLGAVRNFCKYQRPKSPKTSWALPEPVAKFVCVSARDEDSETAFRRTKCESQGGQCAYCRTPITYYTKRADSLEIDHDIPRSRGGSDDPSNLVATCRKCNRAKGSMTGEEFRASFATRRGPKNPDDNAKEKFGAQMEDGGCRKEDGENEITIIPLAAREARPLSPFPADGSISFGPWGDIARKERPGADPDVLAQAFRRWATGLDPPLSLKASTVEAKFRKFCKTHRMQGVA